MTNPHFQRPIQGRARRMIGVQRSYACGRCGAEARTWTRLSTCPRCAEPLTVAVIGRAAFTRA
jgi:predicted amidophosphoribosyltransferase